MRALHLVLLAVAATHASLLVAQTTRRAAHRHPPIVACTDGGPLADTAFWGDFAAAAAEEAEDLDCQIAEISFANGRLSVLASNAGVDELQQLNSRLSQFIDVSSDEGVESLPPFLLEVSSPGLSPVLQSEKDYEAFKGFPVTATTTEPYKNKSKWEGTLVSRDDEFLRLNLKGRPVKIPSDLVAEVRLPSAKTEPGDMLASSS